MFSNRCLSCCSNCCTDVSQFVEITTNTVFTYRHLYFLSIILAFHTNVIGAFQITQQKQNLKYKIKTVL